MAINNAFYTKEDTATGSAVAISTTNPEKYDGFQFFNDHASLVLTVLFKGKNFTVKAGESISIDVRESPNNIKVSGNTCTYRIWGVGR